MKTVNLIYYNNGVGLTRDAQILRSVLQDNFNVIDYNSYGNDCPTSDINIFLQNIDTHTFSFLKNANINILIPNLEWMFDFSIKNLSAFDFVLAKNTQCENILKKLHNNVIYIGFTSTDRYASTIPKTKRFFHFAGKSIQKNTELVIDVFSELNYPITIIDSTQRFSGKIPPFITYITDFLSEEEIIQLCNSHRIHICCSLAEGWGHYMYEALSCKSVVVTNDSYPLHPGLSDKNVFLVKTTSICPVEILYFHKHTDYPLREIHYSDKTDFITIINNLKDCPEERLSMIGENSRNIYNKIDGEFKDKIKTVLKTIL